MTTTTITQTEIKDNAETAVISQTCTNGAAAEPGHPSTGDGGATPEAQKLDVRPAKAVAAFTWRGAKPSSPLAGPPQQPPAPAKPEKIEILHGKFKGVYKVHPIAAMFPLLQGQPFEDFKKSIRMNAQKEPVVIDGDVLLDGRNRVRAQNELGRETWAVKFRTLKLGLTPDKWIEIRNAHRRNMSEDQRIAIAARILAWRQDENARNWLKCRVLVRPNTAASTNQSASQHPATGEEREAAKPSESEYPQEPADNPPKRKRGRPPGRRSAAKAVAAATQQSRYRADQIIELREQAPLLAEAVEVGALKLKEAVRQFKERRKPQPNAAPADPPESTPDMQRVEMACGAGLAALKDIIRKQGVRRWELSLFWGGIEKFVQCEVADLDQAARGQSTEL